MNTIPTRDFDPQHALSRSTFSRKVQSSEDQHHLDITFKERNSALPWRGQFSPQLVEYLLGKHCRTGNTILDPFCGSGTVLYESARLGINAIGLDVNPAAISLAKISELSTVDTQTRKEIVTDLRRLSEDLLSEGGEDITPESATATLSRRQWCRHGKIAADGFLLQLFTDATSVKKTRVSKTFTRYLCSLETIPSFQGNISAKVGDARQVDMPPSSFDYILTSPPYINVFNYHQNYRPIIEALGHQPLRAARSEIGANRKFRQNRFMTVIQYCMDIAYFFAEATRVLRKGGKITIILGRESNVRSTPFRNGELINAIACEGLGFSLLDWHERKFMNRFGASIYEDVLTLSPSACERTSAIEVGRSVGKQSLLNSLDYCNTDRKEEILCAISAAAEIETSALVGNT